MKNYNFHAINAHPVSVSSSVDHKLFIPQGMKSVYRLCLAISVCLQQSAVAVTGGPGYSFGVAFAHPILAPYSPQSCTTALINHPFRTRTRFPLTIHSVSLDRYHNFGDITQSKVDALFDKIEALSINLNEVRS
jgi:hypothetical protein